MSENKSEYEIREENRLDNWDKSTLKLGSFLKDPTPQTKEEIKNKISSEIQTADVKIDPKEGKKLAEALKSKDLDKATALINSMNLSEKPQNIKPINKLDSKETKIINDALKQANTDKLSDKLSQVAQKMPTENIQDNEVKNIFQSHKEM